MANKRKDDIVIKDGDKEILIPKFKQKGMLDHFMILLGVIAAAFVFLVIFDLFYEPSLFGLMFNKEEWDAYRAIMEGNAGNAIRGNDDVVVYEWFPKVYDHNDLLFKGFWMPTIIYTGIFLVCGLGLVMLIIRYIRDYIEVVKGMFKALKELKKGTEVSIKEAILPKDYVVKKSQLEEQKENKLVRDILADASDEKKEKAVKEPKKRGPKPKVKEEPVDVKPNEVVVDEEEERLNRLLMGETVEEEVVKPAETDYVPKPLFSSKD